MRALFVLSTLLVGCVNPQNFDTQVSSALCEKVDGCVADLDVAACKSVYTAVFACYEEHCETFGLSEANACVSAVKGASCDAVLEEAGCDQVWSECSNLELLACQAAAGFGR